MKRIAVLCSLLIVVFGLAGCDLSFGGASDEEPNLIVSLAGANARLAYGPSDADLKLLNAVFVVTKEGAAEGKEHKFQGDTPLEIKVDPGKYTIELSLFYKDGNVPYAKMDAPKIVTVEANKVTKETVTVKRSFAVSGVTVTQSDIYVAPGNEHQFSAIVTIDEALPQVVTWEVKAAVTSVTLKSGTTISPAGGLLKIAADETDGIELTVTATSTLDDKSGSAKVTVGVPPKPALPSDASVTITGGDYWVGGQPLTAALTGTFTEPGIPNYQWKRDGANITGGTSATYTLVSSDIGHTISVTASHSGYTGTVTDALTETILSAEPLPTNATVSISGTATVGSTLMATATNFPAGILTYKWTRGTTSIGTNSATYTLVVVDLNAVIEVEVSHPNHSGIRTATTGTVGLGTLPGTLTITPASPVFGDTLTVNYTGGISVTYQWKKGGVDITNATGNTYKPTETGQYTITIGATGYNDKPSDPITVGPANLPGSITITPSTGVYAGTELTANYSGSESVNFQWNNTGGTISGATSNKYTPIAAGSYTVTVSAMNYNSKESAAVTVTGLSTPVPGDFTFGNLTQTYPGITAVSITANTGKTTGAISNIRYNNSTTLPTAAGSYPVTFDVAASTGWNAASGLSAGTLTINPGTLSGNISITNTGTIYVGITLNANYTGSESVTYAWHKDGASTSIATGGTYAPTAAGSYTVTVSATNYNSKTSAAVTVTGLSTPVAGDFTFGNMTQTFPNITAVTITANTGKTTGAISNIRYSNSTLPTAAGTYAVTFDVAASTGWNAATNLAAGTLTINPGTLSGNISITNTGTIYVGTTLNANYTGSESVTYAWHKDGASTSIATGGTYAPTAAGSYTVTVSATNYNSKESAAVSVSGLSTPVPGDFTFGNLTQTYPGITAVSITANTGKTTGAISNIRYNNSTTLPTATGSYPVTFDVAAATGWNAASGLSAGTLTINHGTLSGNISITNTGTIYVGTTLNANYTGSESVTYAWHKDGATTSIATGATYAPTAAGSYTVTVSLSNYSSKTSDPVTVSGLSTPAVGDYTFGNMTQTSNSISAVTITPNTGKSNGARTIYYEGKGSTIYAKSTTRPNAAGIYAITFDVAAVTGWNAATGLSAGDLTVNLGNINVYPGSLVLGSGTSLTASYSGGSETVSYQWNRNNAAISGANSSTYIPTTAGSYTVTVSLAGLASKTSSNTATVTLPAMPSNAVTITSDDSTPRVGQILTAEHPSLTAAGTPSYQWRRGTYSITNITDATSQTYTLTPADIGETIRVVVNHTGYAGSATSGEITVSTTVYIPGDASWTDITTALNATGKTGTYNLIVTEAITAAGFSASNYTFGQGGKTVNLSGSGSITLTGTGSLLNIASSQTVTMSSLALVGNSGNNASLVNIGSSAFFTMNSGTISGNKAGGGVVVGGTFTMAGGTISGNAVTGSGDGGGVYVSGSSATFTMTGGEVSDNDAFAGGGVYVGTSSKFTMSGNAKVSDNTSGSGVYVSSGTFTMEGGEVSGNIALNGGGVYVSGTSGTFIMNSGTISGNTATGSGGGVFLSQGSFLISKGIVHGSDGSALANTANYGVALFIGSGSAQHGTFSGATWNSQGNLGYEVNTTINVNNGVLQ